MWPCHNCYNNLLPLTLQTLYTVRQFCVCVVWRNNVHVDCLFYWVADYIVIIWKVMHISRSLLSGKNPLAIYIKYQYSLSTKRKKPSFMVSPCAATLQNNMELKCACLSSRKQPCSRSYSVTRQIKLKP